MISRAGVLLLALACGAASAQTIYKCKAADGRITYSSLACTGEGAPLGKAAPVAAAPAPDMPSAKQEPNAPGAARGALPRQCNNGAPLKAVLARLDSAATPDDVRAFLADERFRLMRCEIVRLTPDERRQRDAAMADLESRDAARRQLAMARVEALYERYLTTADRATRASR
jgi:hypothetical protein